MICEIDDNEARVAQRLVLDIKGQSEVLDGWMLSLVVIFIRIPDLKW